MTGVQTMSVLLAESHGWDEVKCAGHCLQLCVNSSLALAPISRMIAVARKIVGHFRHSTLATGALTKRQEMMQIPVKKLQQDVATCWNSSLLMLESLLHSRWSTSLCCSFRY